MKAGRVLDKAGRLIAALWLALLLVLPGCGGTGTDLTVQDAVVASNNTAAVIDALQTSALVLYRFEQELALATAVQKGETEVQAKARIQVVRDTWKPIWDAFEKVRLMHETMATLISTGGSREAIAAAKAALEEKLLTARGLLSIARARVEGK